MTVSQRQEPVSFVSPKTITFLFYSVSQLGHSCTWGEKKRFSTDDTLPNKPLSNEILQKYFHLSNKVAIFLLKRLWNRVVLITDTEQSSYWEVYTHSDGQEFLCPYQKTRD